MSDATALGARMKQRETVTRAILPRRTYCLARVDIRAAHAYLRRAERPYDEQFIHYTEANPLNWRSAVTVLTIWDGTLLPP